MEPIYTPASVNVAYQLRWSLSLFAQAELPPIETWLPQVKPLVEPDGVRILACRVMSDSTWQFYLSTRPVVNPSAIVKSVKGRLQHLIRSTVPQAFRRNFLLGAVGDARREVVEQYVASQLGHHRMSDPRVQETLKKFQLQFDDVDLAANQFTAHGAYLYNLHLVLVHDGRWPLIRDEDFSRSRDMVRAVAKKYGHRLSRLAMLSDHLHLVAGVPPSSSPQDVALRYLNNLAYAHGMTALYSQSYYVGTIGEFDSGAIRRV